MQQVAQYTFSDGTPLTAGRRSSMHRRPSYSAAASEEPGTGSLLTTVASPAAAVAAVRRCGSPGSFLAPLTRSRAT